MTYASSLIDLCGIEGSGNKRGGGEGLESLKVNKWGVSITGELEKLHIFSCVLW